jgi:hypothetical protein
VLEQNKPDKKRTCRDFQPERAQNDENQQIRSAAAPVVLSKPAVVSAVTTVVVDLVFRTSDDVIVP